MLWLSLILLKKKSMSRKRDCKWFFVAHLLTSHVTHLVFRFFHHQTLLLRQKWIRPQTCVPSSTTPRLLLIYSHAEALSAASVMILWIRFCVTLWGPEIWSVCSRRSRQISDINGPRKTNLTNYRRATVRFCLNLSNTLFSDQIPADLMTYQSHISCNLCVFWSSKCLACQEAKLQL